MAWAFKKTERLRIDLVADASWASVLRTRREDACGADDVAENARRRTIAPDVVVVDPTLSKRTYSAFRSK